MISFQFPQPCLCMPCAVARHAPQLLVERTGQYLGQVGAYLHKQILLLLSPFLGWLRGRLAYQLGPEPLLVDCAVSLQNLGRADEEPQRLCPLHSLLVRSESATAGLCHTGGHASCSGRLVLAGVVLPGRHPNAG
eukprot:scaffold2261_cov405-Prasinococcus_capsulatus_cf.AAC.25